MKNVIGRGKKIKITSISIMIFIVIFSMVSMVYVKMNNDESFDRFDRPDPKYSGTLRYSDVEQYKRTEIEFESGENILKGYMYGEKNNKGLIVISHGLGLGAENYLAATMYFVDHGWRVFTFDNTGTHDSEGKSTMGPTQSLLDLKAALTTIRSNNELDNSKIMLYGHSWGGFAVTAILKDTVDIAGVVSIAGFNSSIELLKEQADIQLGMISPMEYPFLWIYQNMIFGDMVEVTATDGINSTDTPVMIIHGVNDKAISYDGASIISHQSEITNPNIIYKTCSEKNHDEHSNAFKSDAAVEYTKVKNLEYKELYHRYDGEIPDEIREKYYQGVDRFQTSEVDVDLMNEINLFFEMQLE